MSIKLNSNNEYIGKVEINNLGSIPNIQSERLEGTKRECKVLISVEYGNKLKDAIKDRVKSLINNLFIGVENIITKQKQNVNDKMAKNENIIEYTMKSISNIKDILDTSTKTFNTNLISNPVIFDETSKIPCKIYIDGKNTYAPVAGTYIIKINLGTHKLTIGFYEDNANNSKNPIEIDLSDLCIGGEYGTSTSSKNESIQEETPVEEQEEQTGGSKKNNKTRIIKLNKLRFFSQESDYDHCE